MLALSRAQAPDAGFRNVSQSLGRVHTASLCKDTKKRVAPTMLPGQLLFLELVKPPRLMLDQEALLFQGFPAPQFLKLVETEGIDVYECSAAASGSVRKRSGPGRKWLTESLTADLAGNAMALPVLLAIVQSAVASLLFRPDSRASTREETADALSALGIFADL